MDGYHLSAKFDGYEWGQVTWKTVKKIHFSYQIILSNLAYLVKGC